jgi:hypothetical protein
LAPLQRETESHAQWKKKADQFAKYMLTLFHPWDLNTGAPNVPLTYEFFKGWIQRLDGTDDLHSCCVMQWMRNISTALYINKPTQSLLTLWRFRSVRPWNAMRPEERGGAQQHHGEQRDTDLQVEEEAGQAADLDDIVQSIITSLQNGGSSRGGHGDDSRDAASNVRSNFARDCIERLWAAASVREIGGFSEHAYAHEDRVPLTVLSIEDIDAAISALNDRQQPENVTTVEDNNGVAQAGRTVPDEHPIAPQQCYSHPSLNIEQNDAFNQCMRWLQEDQSYRNDPRHCAAPDPLNVMILGGPGCGKSFFASKLIESAGSSVIHCCALTKKRA